MSKRRRRIAVVATVAVAAVVALLVLNAGNSAQVPPFRTSDEGGFRVSYPAALRVEAPIPGERMVFLAEKREGKKAPGETLLVRRAPNATANVADDARLLDGLEAFKHRAYHRLSLRKVHVADAVSAYALDFTFDATEPADTQERQLDVIARTATGTSYHLLMVGSMTALSDAVVQRVISGFRLRPE